ncbi:MAG: LruC domain-containing protein [Bacteroidetes bacterium]|nr:LruC domain-containing protein [Bacteroidota bacterium]
MKKIIILLFSISILISCRKESDSTPPTPEVTTMENMVVSQNFNYKTSQDVSIELKAQDNSGIPLKQIRFNVLTDLKASKGSNIVSGATDDNGELKLNIPLPSYYDSVVVTTDYIGLINEIKLPIIGGKATYTFGGINNKKSSYEVITPKATSFIKYLGSYNAQGLPLYLQIKDPIDQSLLKDINSWLPEYKSVPTNNPQYLASSNETNVIINQLADVYVTFVHEGAGYMNVLGFYTYNKNNPPTSASQIDSITIILPNASLAGSGGALSSGDKVKIGTFPANTGIGWVLFANGWTGSSVNANATKYYSDPSFNPETSATYKQHTVLLHDATRGLFLCGFEDMNRNPNVGSDNDFNDIVFYVKSNPVQAISQNNVYQANQISDDSDGDGTSNSQDDYPSDATKSFNNYYPSKTQFGTLAFEDLWPSKGDYDFNDVVVDYQYNYVTNASNYVLSIQATFIVKATGAGFLDGFGFQIPGLLSSAVKSVTGTHLTETGFISTMSNGLEANQSKATIIVFDNAWKNFTNITGVNPDGYSGINTVINGRKGTPDTLNINILLNQPIKTSLLGAPPYNPFIIANKQRGKEIHLADQAPTDLADRSLFGTSNDNSIPLTGRYYKTVNNLPWGLNIVEKFNYPTEKSKIIQGYLKFAYWAQSSGSQYKDWYKSSNGYRNASYIYPY